MQLRRRLTSWFFFLYNFLSYLCCSSTNAGVAANWICDGLFRRRINRWRCSKQAWSFSYDHRMLYFIVGWRWVLCYLFLWLQLFSTRNSSDYNINQVALPLRRWEVGVFAPRTTPHHSIRLTTMLTYKLSSRCFAILVRAWRNQIWQIQLPVDEVFKPC